MAEPHGRDAALMGTKLNAQVTITNLQNVHGNFRMNHFRPPEREGGWNRSIRKGPACKAGDHKQAAATTAEWGGGHDCHPRGVSV